MNCKPGDLALVVLGWEENLGKMVTVVRTATTADLDLYTLVGDPRKRESRHYWIVDRPLLWKRSISRDELRCPVYPDMALKPIPPLGEEEDVEEKEELEV